MTKRVFGRPPPVDAHTNTALNTTPTDGKTLQYCATLGNIHTSGTDIDTGGETSEKPCNCKGFDATIGALPGWRNRQTHRTQNPVASSPKGRNSNDLRGDISDTMTETMTGDAKTSHFDGIRAALAGLSRDELHSTVGGSVGGHRTRRHHEVNTSASP